MPRPARLLLSKSYYHIMTRGNNRHRVFEEDEDYLYYLDLIRKYKVEHLFDLFHYSLMPNHTHMQTQTNRSSDFSVFMKKLNLAYFHYYKRKYDWVGHFWQDRFKSQLIGKDAHFLQCGKYIELNPVRAGIVEKSEDYKYSSYRYYALGEKNDLITPDMFYEEMGGDAITREENYKKIVIDDIVVSSYLKPVWGSVYQQYQETKKRRYHLKSN